MWRAVRAYRASAGYVSRIKPDMRFVVYEPGALDVRHLDALVAKMNAFEEAFARYEHQAKWTWTREGGRWPR